MVVNFEWFFPAASKVSSTTGCLSENFNISLLDRTFEMEKTL